MSNIKHDIIDCSTRISLPREIRSLANYLKELEHSITTITQGKASEFTISNADDETGDMLLHFKLDVGPDEQGKYAWEYV